MDKDKAIRSAKLTAARVLDKARARTAVNRAGGQIAPSKYLPDVPRQVHAAGGKVDFMQGNHPDVPEVLYHGNALKIAKKGWTDEIDPEQTQKNIAAQDFRTFKPSDWGNYGKGIYLTDSPKVASDFAQGVRADRKEEMPFGQVMKLHVSMKQPFTDDALQHPAWKDYIKKALTRHYLPHDEDRNARDAFLQKLDNGTATVRDMFVRDTPHGTMVNQWGNDDIHDTIRRSGFDGIIAHRPDGTKEYVAFKPEQVKSAISATKFDPTDPDMTRAAGGKVLPKGYSIHVDPDRLGVLAHYKGRPVGQLTLSRNRETGDLTAFQMAVHPKHQRKGLMSAMHDAAEDAFGPMKPDQTLTDQGFAFWKGYRPDAVSNNLRFHADKLMGQTVQTSSGPGVVKSVGRNGMNADLTDPDKAGRTAWAMARNNEDVLRNVGIDPSTLQYAAGGYVPQAALPIKRLPVAQPLQQQQQQGSPFLTGMAELAGMVDKKEPEAPQESPSAASEGHNGVSANAQAALDALRKGWTGQDFSVISDYRDPDKNQAVGGAKGSQHLHGNAFDIDTSGWTPEQKLELATQAYNAGFRGFGFYDNNLHFDVGGQRAWGPSYHNDSIPEWAQPWTQQYVYRADGGRVENFQSWFGNSVTHTNGEPHVFYTGTSKDKDFTGFNVGRHGAWFTRDPAVASSYAEQNDSQGFKWDGGKPIRTNTASRVIPAYIKAENPYTGELPDEAIRGNYKASQSDWFDKLRRMGHDAWMPASQGGNLVVALKEPQQIKSIYNNGKFDPKQKHMGKAGGGEIDGVSNNQIGGYENAQASEGSGAAGTQALGLLGSGGVRGSQGVLSAPPQASGEEDLIGLPKSVKMPKLGQTITAAHDPRIRQVARDYARTAGIDYNPPTAYQKVDPARAKRIADAYEAMPHDPQHPLVKASYDALLRETKGQYDAMKHAGVNLEFYPDVNNDPYKSNPRLAVEDLRHNNHMYVYPTDAGYGTGDAMPGADENPMLRDSGERWNGKPVMFNDLFRAVHDYFGHAKEGVGFRADGEENAWRSHAAMFSPLARIALGTETRGQNSWLNYGPHGDKNRNAATEDTVFAPQKLGVLPPWVHHEGAEFIRPHERAQMEDLYRRYNKAVGGALALTRRFTKDGMAATMSLKSKGK